MKNCVHWWNCPFAQRKRNCLLKHRCNFAKVRQDHIHLKTAPACHQKTSASEIYTARSFSFFGAPTVQKSVNRLIGSMAILFSTRTMYKIKSGDLEPCSVRKIIEFILIYMSGPFDSEAISKWILNLKHVWVLWLRGRWFILHKLLTGFSHITLCKGNKQKSGGEDTTCQ